MPKQQNTFHEGLNMDVSDYLMKNSIMRNCKNMRLLDLDGTSYAITTIRGTELKFKLTSGYVPIASVEYGNILYIFSGTIGVGGKYDMYEIGSFDSPMYMGIAPGPRPTPDYAPFNNLDNGPFRVNFWDIKIGSFVDMSVQPAYDRSVNIIITTEDNSPRIINSKFDDEFNIINRREGANTNDYTSGSVDTETRLILRSQKIMNVGYGGIENGGKLQAGNYVYVFRYMTADFNETDVINQSGICSVFEGYEDIKYTTSVNQETTKRVRLTLSKVDTDFAYIKVYFQFTTGENSIDKRVFEFVQPTAIDNKEIFDFIHDGYEDTKEIASEAINLDFTAFDTVTSNTQVSSHLLLGGVKEASVDYSGLEDGAQTITLSTKIKSFGTNLNPYTNPENIYKYAGNFSAETYPYGIVYIMNDGSLSPVFPVQGYDRYNWSNLTLDQQNDIKKKGIYRYDDIGTIPIYTNALGISIKGLTFDISNVPQSVKTKSKGFFIVRGKRKSDLISQGVVIPTLRVPPLDFSRSSDIKNIGDDNEAGSPDGNYYFEFNNPSNYKNFPLLDGLVEPWVRFDFRAGPNDRYVMDPQTSGKLKDGYMPIAIRNVDIPNYVDPDDIFNNKMKDRYAWAYFSADYILNESRYVTELQRSNLGYSQWSALKLEAVSDGILVNKFKDEDPAYNIDTTLLYKFVDYELLTGNLAHRDEIDKMSFISPASFATGDDFVSALSVRFKKNKSIAYQARSFVDGFFGMKLSNLFLDHLSSDSPYNQPDYNWSETDANSATDGTEYANVGKIRKQGYFLSIYPRPSGLPIDDINHVYDTIDGISYHQISDRMLWDDVSSTLDVYGGDCYTGEIHKRLNISGYDDPTTPPDSVAAYGDNISADNLDQGIVFSFIQECEYNPALRLPYLWDVSDPEYRTFYPYKGNGNFIKYRGYRLPETNKTNQGHGEMETPKNFLSLPSNAPYIASNFFSRIVHSEKHVPNAFQNGYRAFVGINYEDYDPDMGKIVRLFTHRDQLFIVFEHGIALGPVNQRIQTGSDSAGAIFVEPSGVLPPTLSFASRKIGAQHGNALIQTPSAIYGMDKDRRKIWQFRDGLLMISDMGFQSFLDGLSPEQLDTPRFGYDPNYHEVIFTVSGWTLCFKEGLEQFTSFYSYKGYHYSHRAKEFYSFNEGAAEFDIHNSEVRTIYGNIEKSYVEFVFNPSPNVAKVADYINIISNEVSPKSIELYTYNIETYKEDILDSDKMFQYTSIDQGVDIFTEEEKIKLRDRKFVAQIPNLMYINDVDWGEGRFRNKYIIVRLTYETDQKVELLSVITDYRFSAS